MKKRLSAVLLACALLLGVAAGCAANNQKSETKSEAAGEAITEDMGEAMMRYMPLRSLISFSGGQVTHEMLAELIEKMNRVK